MFEVTTYGRARCPPYFRGDSLVTIYGTSFRLVTPLFRIALRGKTSWWWKVMGGSRAWSTHSHETQGDHLWETFKVTSYGRLREPWCCRANWVETGRGPIGDRLWDVRSAFVFCLGLPIRSTVASFGVCKPNSGPQGDHLWDAFPRNLTSLPSPQARRGGEVTTYGKHDGLFWRISHSWSPLPPTTGCFPVVGQGREDANRGSHLFWVATTVASAHSSRTLQGDRGLILPRFHPFVAPR